MYLIVNYFLEFLVNIELFWCEKTELFQCDDDYFCVFQRVQYFKKIAAIF